MTRLQQQFAIYHAENPRVYELFIVYARTAKAAGHTQFGAGAIFERLRWHISVETKGDPFKLNNNYRAFYARKLMAEYPEFKDFFSTRVQKSEASCY